MEPMTHIMLVVLCRKESLLLENPSSLFHTSQRWSRRGRVLGAVALLVVVVSGLAAGLILVKHPGSAQASGGGPNPSSGGGGATVVPQLQTLSMQDTRHGWALNIPDEVTQTDTGITSTSTNQYEVLITNDGGNQWQDVTPPGIQPGTPITPDFVSASLAWLLVGANQLYVTTNGGQTWKTRSAPDASLSNTVDHITFLNAEVGWLILSDASNPPVISLFRTTNSGRSWVNLQNTNAQVNSRAAQLPLQNFQRLTFLDARTGWAAGENASTDGVVVLYTTHDGGATWQQRTAALPADGFSGPSVDAQAPEFFNARDGILDVVSSTAVPQAQIANLPQSGILGRVIYVTHNGGATWTSGALLPDPQGSVSFSDAHHGWVASSFSLDLWSTSDGGANWTLVSSSGLSSYAGGGGGGADSAIDFVSSQVGWATREDPIQGTTLFKTVDGGQTWTQLALTISQ